MIAITFIMRGSSTMKRKHRQAVDAIDLSRLCLPRYNLPATGKRTLSTINLKQIRCESVRVSRVFSDAVHVLMFSIQARPIPSRISSVGARSPVISGDTWRRMT